MNIQSSFALIALAEDRRNRTPLGLAKRARHAELLHVLGFASQPSATLPAVVADASVEEESSSCAQATGARLARVDTLRQNVEHAIAAGVIEEDEV